MIWFKTSWMSDHEYREVEIIKETPKFIYVKNFGGTPYRELKKSTYSTYHKTEEEAYSFLKKRLQDKIKHAEKTILDAKRKITSISKIDSL